MVTEELKKRITDFVRSRDHNYQVVSQVVNINLIIDMDSTKHYYRVIVKIFNKIGKFTNTSYINVNEYELKQFERDNKIKSILDD